VQDSQRIVGKLCITLNSNGHHTATFHGQMISLPRSCIRMLWILAAHPDELVPKVKVYEEMYGDRHPDFRPEPGILKVFASRVRTEMRSIEQCGSDAHLRSNYRGSMGLFSVAAPLPCTERRGKKRGILRQLREAQAA
jgi:DNA-binding response OmpR family regulator